MSSKVKLCLPSNRHTCLSAYSDSSLASVGVHMFKGFFWQLQMCRHAPLTQQDSSYGPRLKAVVVNVCSLVPSTLQDIENK